MPIGFSLTLLFSVRLTRVLLPTTRSRKDKYQPDQVVCLSCTVGLVITGVDANLGQHTRALERASRKGTEEQ